MFGRRRFRERFQFPCSLLRRMRMASIAIILCMLSLFLVADTAQAQSGIFLSWGLGSRWDSYHFRPPYQGDYWHYHPRCYSYPMPYPYYYGGHYPSYPIFNGPWGTPIYTFPAYGWGYGGGYSFGGGYYRSW